MWILALLASFSIMFGLRHKAWFLYGYFYALDSLLDCAYCLGFWTGWLVWFGAWIATDRWLIPVDGHYQWIMAGFLWALASSTFCYLTEQIIDGISHE